MSYIGAQPTSVSFPFDTFSGDGSTTAFTMQLAPASVNSVIVVISGVLQTPSTYSVSGTTLTFTQAPPTGTSNISVRYLGLPGIPNTPTAGSVNYSSLNADNQSKLGISFKNRLINGAMVIDQRNAGASVTPTNLAYTLDRWFAGLTQSSKYTVQQNAGSVTPPVGFTNYLGVTSSSAYSVLTGDTFYIAQSIEGFNCADLGWGTANAKTVTLSFQVYSSLTGTFGGSITNRTGRSYPFSYTVSSANTWTPISITIAGDTSGTWATNNTASVSVYFGLGSGSTYTGTAGAWAGSVLVQSTGSVSVVGTNGATFYITGVQLEVGTTATQFDYRSYGTELALCQRYYSVINDVFIRGYGYSAIGITLTLPTTMRSTPTVTKVGTWAVSNALQPTAGTDLSTTNTASIQMQLVPSVPGDCYTYTATTANYVSASSEL